MPQLYLDCDGVLADFDTAAREVLGICPRQFEERHGSDAFWELIRSEGEFYANLPLMPGAERLVQAVWHLKPIILTGCPKGGWAEDQKLRWAERHFPGIKVITCRSADKSNFCIPGDILVDDWPQYRHRWIRAGGRFISHYDADTSIAAIQAELSRNA